MDEVRLDSVLSLGWAMMGAMTDDDWVPFGADPVEYRVLVDGVPAWLRISLLAWLLKHFDTGGRLYSSPRLLAAARELRLSLRADPTSPYTQTKWILEDVGKLTETELLRVADWVVRPQGLRSSSSQELDQMLTDASSKWQVGLRNGKPGLVERVPAGVQDAAEALIATGGAAGSLLADAWQKVHRLDPDDSGAYASAVKAVEVSSLEALAIDNSKGKATLGNSIRALEQDSSWRLPFAREPRDHPTNSTLVSMMRTLFGGHRDRHGKADYSSVTHEEAEAAVNLAVTLIGWFTSGAVQHRPEPERY